MCFIGILVILWQADGVNSMTGRRRNRFVDILYDVKKVRIFTSKALSGIMVNNKLICFCEVSWTFRQSFIQGSTIFEKYFQDNRHRMSAMLVRQIFPEPTCIVQGTLPKHKIVSFQTDSCLLLSLFFVLHLSAMLMWISGQLIPGSLWTATCYSYCK